MIGHNDLNNNMGGLLNISVDIFLVVLLLNIELLLLRIVTFFYEDLANDKKETVLTLDIESFLSKLLIHIPPKNFRMIYKFGIYGRNVKLIMKTMRKYVSKYTKKTFYQLKIWNTFNVNPFYCFGCNILMRIKEIYYENIYTGSIFHKEYVYKN